MEAVKRPRGRPRRVPEVQKTETSTTTNHTDGMTVIAAMQPEGMFKTETHSVSGSGVGVGIGGGDTFVTIDTAIPERPAMRAPMREESPLDAAKARAAEILDNIGEIDTGSDEFYFDPDMVPEGWTYEWKRMSVYNQKDPAYEVSLRRMGWTPVPASRHPEMTAPGEQTIDRKGQQLMERPQIVTDRVIALDKKRARDQVRAKEEQLSAAPAGTFERSNKDQPLAKIKKEYSPMVIPD